jgi:hypothetical protein
MESNGDAESACSQADLRHGLFRRQVQRGRRAGGVVRELQKQRGFADPRLSA